MPLVKNVLAVGFEWDGHLARRHARHIAAARTELARPERRMSQGAPLGIN